MRRTGTALPIALLVAGLVAGPVAGGRAESAGPAPGTHAYGADRRQSIDLYRPGHGRAAPLILFVHGGGWSAGSKQMGEGVQPAYFTGKGYAWASIDYRLVPSVTVEDQAADLVAAIGWLVKHARGLRIDTRRIVLIAHSSGAQLAGLVATDPQWLKAAGVPFETLAGVVSLDGAGVDIPGAMLAGAAGSPFYRGAFGFDVDRQTRLSPIAHLGVPDAPAWLFLYDSDHNQAAGAFARRFAAKAGANGAKAEVVAIPGTSHMGMLNGLGTPGDAATDATAQFLGTILPAGIITR